MRNLVCTCAAIGALVLLTTPQVLGAPPQSPRVILQPSAMVFDSGSDVEIRLTVENTGHTCLPIFIDPSFFPVASPHRPHMVVTFAVFDEEGRRIQATEKVKSTPRGLRAADLLVLDCNAFYGRYLHLSGGEWDYPIRRGRYRVRAKVESSLGTFTRSRADLRTNLQQATGLPVATLRELLRDFAVESDEVRFEVKGD